MVYLRHQKVLTQTVVHTSRMVNSRQLWNFGRYSDASGRYFHDASPSGGGLKGETCNRFSRCRTVVMVPAGQLLGLHLPLLMRQAPPVRSTGHLDCPRCRGVRRCLSLRLLDL
jgi:hypothetical protein